MFELSVAIKYLTPRWRQLSVSIISLISILVIALVVWLVVVFFSVTNGLTNSWIDKMIALTAPVRITPTEEYYNSYYHNIDGISAASDYQIKSLREKLLYQGPNPYDPAVDEALPDSWPQPDLDSNGNPKNLVKDLFSILETLPPQFQSPSSSIFEITSGQLRLFLERGNRSKIEQSVFLSSFDPNNTLLINSVLPTDQIGIANLHHSVFRSHDENVPTQSLQKSKDFAQSASIHTALLRNQQLFLPHTLFDTPTSFKAIGLYKNSVLTKILIPTEECSPGTVDLYCRNFDATHQTLSISKDHNFFPEDQEIDRRTPIYVLHDKSFPVKSVNGDIEISMNVQGIPIQTVVPVNRITPVKYVSTSETPLWFKNQLPSPSHFGNPILLPKSYRDSGVMVGDLGSIGYSVSTASAIQEQRIPIYVSGFYDPGIIPSGGKFLIAGEDLVSEIRGAQGLDDSFSPSSTGINIRISDREMATALKDYLVAQLKEKGISQYWKVETFKEFDFSKDLIKQLGSEKRLFSLLAGIIIIVACSNIISMLIILVNDKKKEIGILRSMGASSFSIMLIFGTCGIVMGIAGSLLGTIAALFTLQNLQSLVNFISWIQGYEMFNPLYYGETLPSHLSMEAFMFVITATGAVSLLAGIIPAVKACLLKPSATLRSE